MVVQDSQEDMGLSGQTLLKVQENNEPKIANKIANCCF